ncbi:MAG: hypothetical protein IT200_11025 [Thermoleophilia bacterium]|nr:hypothetical protein [Thermoleophilia bacterium]
MQTRTAIVIRRSAILTGAITATVGVHVISAGHVAVLPAAPFGWLSIVAALIPLMTVAAPRTFTARPPLVLLGITLTAQAAAHLAMSAAPWAFGLVEYHDPAPATPVALVAHLAAAVLLALLLAKGERILAAAVAVAQAIILTVLPAPRQRPRPSFRVPFSPLVLVTQAAGRPRSSRGPPRPSPGTPGPAATIGPVLVPARV